MKAFWLPLFLLLQFSSFAQEKFKKVITGKLPLKIFAQDDELKQWYLKEYESYQPNEAVLKKLKEHLADKRIVVVLGTWCSDSQRDFPHLMKVLDDIHFPHNRLVIYGINKQKSKPYRIASKYSITHVPTIILINKDGAERGRIIETVTISLEADLLSF
ncbi:MAG: thioredoxin family protein [Bacteroidota bacterium]